MVITEKFISILEEEKLKGPTAEQLVRGMRHLKLQVRLSTLANDSGRSQQ